MICPDVNATTNKPFIYLPIYLLQPQTLPPSFKTHFFIGPQHVDFVMHGLPFAVHAIGAGTVIATGLGAIGTGTGTGTGTTHDEGGCDDILHIVSCIHLL